MQGRARLLVGGIVLSIVLGALESDAGLAHNSCALRHGRNVCFQHFFDLFFRFGTSP